MIDPKKIEGHTPGPWFVDPLGLGTVGDVSTADAEAVAQAQARIPIAARRADDERAANAALIAAAPELYAFWLANQWQPIETAPRDGTLVLLWTPAERQPVNVGFCTSTGWVFWDGDCFWLEQMQDDYARLVDYGGGDEPTHWRPIPAPPEPGK